MKNQALKLILNLLFCIILNIAELKLKAICD